ncbi:hypothetical protein [Nocardioides bigeumensis]|uniref:Uncharacterized protein n=1 Tax=Nocardioides bigeumensis TaxID=433657 RepID=A0ABN2XRI0_9ACTN
MKNRKLSRHQAGDLELIVSSGLFDEDYYREQNPDVVATGTDLARHYLTRGAREGRDPSPHFSSAGYLARYRDVRFSAWNPLVHYLRSGREEGRLPDPMGDDSRLIRGSGLFDETYYREANDAAIPEDADAVDHYVREGAGRGLDPSEGFSTSDYLRLNPGVEESGINPLAHYLRYGRAGGLDSLRGAPRRGSFRAQYAAKWAGIASWPVVRVPGVGPRVSLVLPHAGAGESLDALLVLGTLLANSLGASLRLVGRDAAPDAALLLHVARRHGAVLLGDVELSHLPSGSAHPLLMGDRDVVLVSGWRETQSAMASALGADEIVRVLLDDERAAYLDGDERLMCAETLAVPHGSPVAVAGQALLDRLCADFPQLRDEAVSFEPAFPDVRRAASPADDGRRTLLVLAEADDPRSLYWRGGEALCQAIERNVVDPQVWDVIWAGAEPGLVLARDVRPRVLTRTEWLTERPHVDAVFVPTAGDPAPRESVSEAASGAAVLTTTAALLPSLLSASANLLACDPAIESMVEGLGRLATLGLDDDLRRRHVEDDQLERDWTTATREAVAFLHDRLEDRLGSGRHVR